MMTPESDNQDEPSHDSSKRREARRAAMRLFDSQGYVETSFAEIAHEAGLSTTELSSYYESKGDLLLEELRRSFGAWNSGSRGKLRGGDSCRDRLWGHLRTLVQFVRDHPDESVVFRVATPQIGGETGERLRAIVAIQRNSYQEDLEAFFAEAIERKEVQQAHPADLARSWRSFVSGLLNDLVFQNKIMTPSEERLRGMWEIVWRGLEGAPKAGARGG